jgi:hypothetical protein
MPLRNVVVLLPAIFLVFGIPVCAQSNWKEIFEERLPLYGHRNWIVVADSAYPAQTRPGIETIVADADQLSVLKTVLTGLAQSRHVRPIVYLDRELPFLNDGDAPGVSAYRQQLTNLLNKAKPTELIHEQIISKLDQAGQTFRILIIKSNSTIPYTSVFLQLDCAYWGAHAEQRLRAEMAAHPEK